VLKEVVVESTCNWCWLVDGLQEQGYRVHLAKSMWRQPVLLFAIVHIVKDFTSARGARAMDLLLSRQ